ncbi:MAG TPA: hypothetical protein VNO22_10225 [Planctomycetota bacterium]|nr:hypothetical protein [Planctomycetota bacterium]
MRFVRIRRTSGEEADRDAARRPRAATVGAFLRVALEEGLRPALERARAGLAATALLAVAAAWLLLGVHQALRAAGAPAWAASLAMGALSAAAGLAFRRRARPRAKT